ncbi:hypothetical protein [Micromonospora sp. KC213]|uniref:hypothetical protein n=1 Tax=Micromonospora sp. KC213 TaxID=2530378 RepID=UPI00104FEAA3|nr:hypothetical protein [Micromonospora sp. KC213]TDC42108.1 hypothetical protein E1166_09125 [Micromonospora sp. KC213]
MVTPDVPPGTRVALRSGQWMTHLGVLGAMDVDLRIVHVGGEEHPLGLVWVRAHGLDCRLESVACAREWCIRVAVLPTALYDALNE